MKNFIRNNPTIAFGLGLPLVLVVLFVLTFVVNSLARAAVSGKGRS